MTHLNNPPPSYAITIFNSANYSFSCPNCISIKPLTRPHKLPTSNTNTKPSSVIPECNTKPESHTTPSHHQPFYVPSPLLPNYSILKPPPALAYPSILKYISQPLLL